MTHDVFISYSRKDTAVADKITQAFDEAGISYFIDRQGIAGGMEFPDVLAQAIKESKVFLFLASENSYNSKFTQSEIVFAFNKKRKEDIIPYIIDGTPLPDALELTFSSINWRDIRRHPIETIVDDVLQRLGRERQPKWETESEIGDGMAALSHLPPPLVYYLKLKSDTDCRFFLDGEEKLVLKAGVLQKIPLNPGEYELRFVSGAGDVVEMAFVMPEHDKFQNVSYTVAHNKPVHKNLDIKKYLPWIIGGAVALLVALLLVLLLTGRGNGGDTHQAVVKGVTVSTPEKSGGAAIETTEISNNTGKQLQKQERVIPAGYVDLGLQSGTLWNNKTEEGGFYTYDEAVSKFGNKVPSKAQWEELINTCTWTWNGCGYQVEGTNGNSIVLPASGYRFCDGDVIRVGFGGRYWSSTPSTSEDAWRIGFNKDGMRMRDDSRCDGLSVRLVQD